MSSLLALDPGLNNPAAAVFQDGLLVGASRVKPRSEWRTLDVAERCRLIALSIHAWARGVGIDQLTCLVVEWPQIYVRGRQKGDPNDLVPLAGVAMALAGRLDVEVKSYKPAEWIGQCKKAETGDPLESPRGRLIWRHLDEAERGAVSLSHDALDAIGLGLAALGRLRLRVYPGAS